MIEFYDKEGKLIKIDSPVFIECADGTKYWVVNGVESTEKEFIKIKSKPTLEYEVVTADENFISIRITKQENFSLKDVYLVNGVKIQSWAHPDYSAANLTLFVWGSSENLNALPINIPISQWPQVCIAIKDLNMGNIIEITKK